MEQCIRLKEEINKRKYNFGTSHADGSYRNCGISIPIAYCIDRHGEPVFISKSDTSTRIVDLSTKETKII